MDCNLYNEKKPDQKCKFSCPFGKHILIENNKEHAACLLAKAFCVDSEELNPYNLIQWTTETTKNGKIIIIREYRIAVVIGYPVPL
jgi:hypothetical protein